MKYKNRTIADYIDLETAPITQWEDAIEDGPDEGKQKEDAVTHKAVAEWVADNQFAKVTDIIADEARLSIEIAKASPNTDISHLTLSGKFEKVAKNNVKESGLSNIEVSSAFVPAKVRGRSDAIIMNMILGCVACNQDPGNMTRFLGMARELINDDGKLLLIRPNPSGGEFETYKCVTPEQNLVGGTDYEFVVAGLEDLEPMKNFYTPDDYLVKEFRKAGFEFGKEHFELGTEMSKSGQPAFIGTVCKTL